MNAFTLTHLKHELRSIMGSAHESGITMGNGRIISIDLHLSM